MAFQHAYLTPNKYKTVIKSKPTAEVECYVNTNDNLGSTLLGNSDINASIKNNTIKEGNKSMRTSVTVQSKKFEQKTLVRVV